jgi:hypothetical protein
MHIVFTKSYDIWHKGKAYIVERTLGKRLLEMGVAIAYTDHLDMIAREKVAEELSKKKEEKKKAEDLLKKKEEVKTTTAISVKAKRRSKSIKK